MDKKVFQQAEDFVTRSGARYYAAREHLNKSSRSYYPEAITNCHESIELAAKAVFLFVVGRYPQEHDLTNWSNKEVRKVLEEIQGKWPEVPDLPIRCLARLVNYNSLWATFYARSKYGVEPLRVGAQDLFDKEDVELALRHAQECNLTTRLVLNWARKNLQ